MQAELAAKWLALDEGAKAQIRQLLLATLPAEVGVHCLCAWPQPAWLC